jgi:hypothetical protein
VVTALAVWGASKLELRTDFRELLPRNYRSISDLEHIERRAGGSGSLILAVESPDPRANVRFVDTLAAALSKLPRETVRWVDWNVREERAFFDRHKMLYADLADLARFRDELRVRIEEEKRKRDPFHLGLEDAPSTERAPRPKFDLEDYRRKYREKVRELDRYPDGYYVGEGGKLATVTLRIPGSAMGVDSARRILAELERIVSSLGPTRHHPEMKVGMTGDVRTAVEEYEATKDDLVFVSVVCMALIILVVVLFFRSVRSLVVLGVPLLMGVAWTFGITAIAIGFLNASTMFLASIVAGNGVNFGIILLARYMEERRGGADVRTALFTALRHTTRATMVAALAAGIAYGSLLATDFRGFNQFGFIGGVGMLVCWLATFAVLPPLVVLSERVRPLVRAPLPNERRVSRFALGFATLATRWPRAVVLCGLAVFAASAVAGALFLARDPFLYNFRYLRNVESRDRGSGALANRAAPIAHTRFSTPAGMILLADDIRHVPEIEAELWKRNLPGQAPAVGGVTTIFSLLPAEQQKKIPVLREIRALIVENRTAMKFLSAEQRREIERITPAADVRELAPADLPEKMARPFTDVDGVRGVLLYARMPEAGSVWDGRDLIRFGAAVREVKLADGTTLHASGHPVIFADMITAVLHDGPRAALLSFLGVLLLCVVAFRRMRLRLLVIGALVVGVTWLLGVMGGWDLLVRHLQASGRELSEGFVGAIPKINFLNFIVIPLTIGIGVDYSVNIAQRYTQEGAGSMQQVLSTTGGAVVLCSLTTIIGYSALLLSRNLALVSFGKLANLGEVACLVASLTVLPAAVLWLERRKERRLAQPAE